jgi:hypothetical protein
MHCFCDLTRKVGSIVNNSDRVCLPFSRPRDGSESLHLPVLIRERVGLKPGWFTDQRSKWNYRTCDSRLRNTAHFKVITPNRIWMKGCAHLDYPEMFFSWLMPDKCQTDDNLWRMPEICQAYASLKDFFYEIVFGQAYVSGISSFPGLWCICLAYIWHMHFDFRSCQHRPASELR